jgi:Transposase zinc-ribbon domain
MSDFPRSLIEFQSRFPDEAACIAYLFAARWPHGFVCPACGGCKAWQLQTKAWTWECAGCGQQTSVIAGTIMHHSKLPLTTWFWAAYLMASHSNRHSSDSRWFEARIALSGVFGNGKSRVACAAGGRSSR